MTNTSVGALKRYTLWDENRTASFTFTAHGGTPLELHFTHKGQLLQILDGFKTDEQIISNEKSRNIFLIPFPNRIRDGVFTFREKTYQLPINKPKENNAIHGFIWNRNFEVAQSGNSATLSYAYPGDFPGYPFPFLTKIIYALSSNSLSVTLDVSNTGETTMPLGIGWHPYFTFRQQVENLQLQLPHSALLEADERMIPTGSREEYSKFKTLQPIGNTNFDTAFALKDNAPPETKLYDAHTQATIIIQQEPGFKYLQVYIPPERTSIAVEPMTCPANAFNTGEGLITLESGKRFTGQMKVMLT